VKEFLEKTFSLAEKSIEEYRSRGFKRLMVSYGCTGGQHRSVYSAECLNEYLRNELNVNTILVHREFD
jgi:RNase adaptor protein for sRNA GlmZ degradation